MKIKLITCLTLAFIAILSIHSRAQYIDGPEGIAYDTISSCYLIANANNGSIVSIDEDGNQAIYYAGLSTPLGLYIVDTVLYVTTNRPFKVIGIDLIYQDILFDITISGPTGLNGIASVGPDLLYVIDQGGKIYEVSIRENSYTTLVNSGLPAGPQALLYDDRYNRLIVACYQAHSAIKAVNLDDTTITTLLNTGIGGFTGITRDDAWNLYLTSWTTGGVFKVDSSYNEPPEVISTGHSQPTGVFYDIMRNTLVVSNFGSSTIDFIDLGGTGIDEPHGGNLPEEHINVYSYPNPFNASTVIEYQLPVESNLEINVYDILGRKVDNIFKGTSGKGTYSVTWDASNYPSGVYYYRLTADDGFKTGRMLLLR